MKIPAAFMPCTPYKKKFSLSSLEVPRVTITKQIAEGSFYKIFLTTRGSILRVSKNQMRSSDEIKILKVLNHPFINKMHRWWVEDSFLYFEIERCDFSLKEREKKIEKFFKKNQKGGVKFRLLVEKATNQMIKTIESKMNGNTRKRIRKTDKKPESLPKPIQSFSIEEIDGCLDGELLCDGTRLVPITSVFPSSEMCVSEYNGGIFDPFSESLAICNSMILINSEGEGKIEDEINEVNSPVDSNDLFGSKGCKGKIKDEINDLKNNDDLSGSTVCESKIRHEINDLRGNEDLSWSTVCESKIRHEINDLKDNTNLAGSITCNLNGKISDDINDLMDNTNLNGSITCNLEGKSIDNNNINRSTKDKENPNIKNFKFSGKIFNKNNETPENKWIFIMMYQISTALSYIHSKNIVHMDVKPENILVKTLGSEITFMLSDFNISKIGEGQFDLDGDKIYMAPEILDNKCYFKSDVYALGLIYLELNGSVELPTEGEEYSKLRKNDFRGWEMDEITRKMLEMNPDSRISAHEVSEYFYQIIC